MNSLLAAGGGWIIDILFFAVLLGGIWYGVYRGFIEGVCKIAGTIFSIVVAVVFCVSLQASLERNFGATSALNDAIGAPFGEWIMIAVSFIFLLGITKLGCWLLGTFGSAIVENRAPLRLLNKFLGGILGAFQFFIIFFVVLAIFRWIPSDSFHEFISSSGVVGKIFDSEWFISATQINFKISPF